MSHPRQDPERVKGTLGFAPIEQVAATVFGPVIDRDGFEAAKLTGMVGAATGSPSTQSVIYSLQHDSVIGFSSPADYGDALAALDGDDEVGNGNFNLDGAKRYVRVKAVVAFTGGSTPAQLIGAALELMGAVNTPTSD